MSKKLKAYIKRIRKGDEIQVSLKDGYKIEKSDRNGFLIKSEDLASKPVFVSDAEFRRIIKHKNGTDWIEILGQGVE